MSEPDAGSDAMAMTTSARRDGDEWVINGTKQWITNSPEADWVFVWAVTDPDRRRRRKGGISCFVVPTVLTVPGFSVDSVISLFGQPGGHEGIISFVDVRVPEDALVGELHEGFADPMAACRPDGCTTPGNASAWPSGRSTRRPGTRPNGPRSASRSPSTRVSRSQLADRAVEIYAGDAMARSTAATLLESGMRAHQEVAMTKIYTTEMCSRVYERCMQVHGAMGLRSEMRLYDGWHQARLARIADGTAEILRRNTGVGSPADAGSRHALGDRLRQHRQRPSGSPVDDGRAADGGARNHCRPVSAGAN